MAPPAPAGVSRYVAAVLVPRRGPSSTVPVELVVPPSGTGYLSDDAARAKLVLTWTEGTHAEALRGFRSGVSSTSLLAPSPRRDHPAPRARRAALCSRPPGRAVYLPGRLAIGYVIGFAAASGVALLRQPGVPAIKTIWAEDGRIFYAQATTLSFWRTLTTLHNGYMQLFPRLAVQLARVVPVGDVSTVLALVGALSLGALCCLVFHMARGQIASPGLRGLLAAGMVLLPVANVELLNNLVNVPWWLFFAAFWALIWRPTSWPGRAVAALLCFLAAASEALVGLFLPLALVRWAALARNQRPGRRRRARSGPVLPGSGDIARRELRRYPARAGCMTSVSRSPRG